MDIEKENSLTCCPVARGLAKVGDAWSMLILRDLSLGLSRFEELRVSLGIAPNILTARLRALGEAGLVVKRRYSERPPRDEYVLSDAGRDFLPVLHVIGEWGRRHNGAGGTSRLVDTETETLVEPVVVDRLTGKPLAGAKLRVAQPDDPLVSGAPAKRGWLLD
ncbi:helix-turn-helix transcriptional regulator [Sphingomonas sp. R-74633]|uniref:winged helix-turn-helix transcriptional regulator n=1 Tax=Sphingomonas sp. R-74633 TaxID=2751188 RepID=UPI0015D2A011|nr:helix-turn-helix domain-containing protein [Sphingomonas sp. R-74633]NYT40367.1 helix-turn-helix transcriptional regulator [Sphingomonas sp. R-74633]